MGLLVVSGYSVPFMRAQAYDGTVALTLGDRFGLDLKAAEARRVVPFLADAIAIALGYPAHPTLDMPLPPHPIPQRVAPERVVCFDDRD